MSFEFWANGQTYRHTYEGEAREIIINAISTNADYSTVMISLYLCDGTCTMIGSLLYVPWFNNLQSHTRTCSYCCGRKVKIRPHRPFTYCVSQLNKECCSEHSNPPKELRATLFSTTSLGGRIKLHIHRGNEVLHMTKGWL